MLHSLLANRARRAGLAVATGLAFAAVPSAAQASTVDLATTAPFVVLGGSTVMNTGPSVLNGDLGVAPGAALVGFGLPAVVNGATHANDAVATQAQSDLATAYGVAASQPVAPSDDLTGTDLGNRTLRAGAYRFSTSAQLTGALTLDAAGDPTAQFVFEIGSTLTTAPASSVVLINGASPCNIFWQVGSSATLGTTTSFAGNLMARSSISLATGASVQGRVLASTGAVTLDDNILSRPDCTTPTPTPTPTTDSTPSPTATPPATSPDAGTDRPTAGGTSGAPTTPPAGTGTPIDTATPERQTTVTSRRGTAILQRVGTPAGADSSATGFDVAIRGAEIARVTFFLDGRPVATRTRAAFRVRVRATPGEHVVRARITFKDATPTTTRTLRVRVASPRSKLPHRGPSRFAG